MCRGLTFCNNSKLERDYCTNWHECPHVAGTEKCGQVHDKNTHNECRLRSSAVSSSQFDCLNRADEATHIFNRTIFKPIRPLSPNLNALLNFDEEHLYCRENVIFKWNSSQLTQLNSKIGNIKYCLLKNGEAISDFKLYHLLLKDQGFIGRNYFQKGWLNQRVQ